jgi:hypothetical protein
MWPKKKNEVAGKVGGRNLSKVAEKKSTKNSLLLTFFKDSLKIPVLNSVGYGSFLTSSASRKSRTNFHNNWLKHAVLP